MNAPEPGSPPQVDWRSLSACRAEDPELFFPLSASGPGVAQLAMAKAVCARCLVRADCLEFALSTGQVYGVWGGTSEEERTRIWRVRASGQRASRQPAGQC
jgi:WhiB family transcriptional regulator, redox-sensing transcriptional regulator